MKRIVYLLIAAHAIYNANCQTVTEKSFPVTVGQKVKMIFKYPELIRVETWDKNEISIKATVSINYGADDSAFEIEVRGDEILQINSIVKDHDFLPRKILIKYEGEEYFFNSPDVHAPEVQKFLTEIGYGSYDYMQRGVIKEITLDIMVPTTVLLEIEAKFGMIEIVGFTNEMSIHSKFGGIDASVSMESDVIIHVKTKFGDAYSNLDIPFTGDHDFRPGRWTTLEGRLNGTINTQLLKSDFGNIYIRKL